MLSAGGNVGRGVLLGCGASTVALGCGASTAALAGGVGGAGCVESPEPGK